MSDTTDSTTNYSKFRIPLAVTECITNFYELGLQAFENGLDENPADDPAFTMALLTIEKDQCSLTDYKAHWRNGWMDAYQNKYHRSITNY